MILQNAVYIIPEKRFLISTHRHDFVSTALDDGTLVAVDGGYDYFRTVGTDHEDVVDFCLTDGDDLEKIEAMLLWGTYGKYGDEPLRYVRLMDCTTEHLKAILQQEHIEESQSGTLGSFVRKVCQRILDGRAVGVFDEPTKPC